MIAMQSELILFFYLLCTKLKHFYRKIDYT